MGPLMPPKEYRSWFDDFEEVVKWTSITFGGLLLIPVLMMSCCCLGLVLEPTINRFKWGDCEVEIDYYCNSGTFLIYNDEGLLLDRKFKWVEPPKWENSSGGWKDHNKVGWNIDFSRLNCLPDQDAFHVLDAECVEVIFRYEGGYRIVEYCNGG